MSFLLKLIRWILEKFAAAALMVVLGTIACGLWLFLKDNVEVEHWHQEVRRALNGQRAETRAALDDVLQRMARISAAIAAQQERAKTADSAISRLRELESAWDRLVGNPEQQKANAQQLEKMTGLRLELQGKIQQLRRDLTRATWEKDGLEIALGKLDTRIASVEARQSRLLQHVEHTWNYPLGRGALRLPVKGWVLVFLGLYFLGPTVGKYSLYSFLAPLIARGKPVRLAAQQAVMPEVGESRVTADLALAPGECLWVKEKFLQASDEGLRRRTRFLLDWRIPFTCCATGLVELIEMRNHVAGGGDQRVTLSNQGDPHSELAVVTLPLGAALILRPSYLAGVVVAEARRLTIRRRWQLWRWQAWVTLQFRFFEFVGPCRLIVAGSRGVRAERLVDRTGEAMPARRTNQDATIGFTPNLDYRPVRAETFWSYYRGMNPLFDDLFVGRGIFLCQQVAVAGAAGRARHFWAGVWGGVMKLFGL